MNYKLYQPHSPEDGRNARCGDDVPQSAYLLMYEDDVEPADDISRFLEWLFMRFNDDELPRPHRGTSMPVGDVIVIGDREAYRVASIGFKQVHWNFS